MAHTLRGPDALREGWQSGWAAYDAVLALFRTTPSFLRRGRRRACGGLRGSARTDRLLAENGAAIAAMTPA
jgi:hypothetical protein